MIWHKVSSGELPELTDISYDACYYEFKRSELVLVKFDGKIMTGYYCGEDGWKLNGMEYDTWLLKGCVTEWAAIEDKTHVVSANAKPEDRCCPVCKAYIPTDTWYDTIFPDDIHYCYSCGAKLEVSA